MTPLPEDRARMRATFMRLFPGLSLVMAIAVADNTLVATALPTIAADLGNPERVSLVVVAYMLAAMLAAPVYGLLGDLFGLRLVLFAALGLFTTGSLLCTLAPSLPVLVVFRVLQGLGGGGLMVLAQALLSQAISPRERGRFQGYLASIVVCSQGLAPALGAPLTAAFGWPAVFLLNLPLAALSFVLLLRVPALPGRGGAFRLDIVGITLLALTLSAAMSALMALQDIARSDGLRLAASACATAVLIALLFRNQSRSSYPLIPIALLRNPTILLSDLVAMAHGAFLVATIVLIPTLFRVRYGLTTAELGLTIMPMSLGMIVGASIIGNLVTRTGRTTIWGMVGMAIGAGLMFTAAALPCLTQGQMAAMLFGLGICSSTVMGPVQIMIATAAGREHLGSASASVQFARILGTALGTALTSALLFLTLACSGVSETFVARLTSTAAGPVLWDPAIDIAFSAVFVLLGLFAASGGLLLSRISLTKV
ncbi:MFS transporter [Frigidibacter albus]|uniref:MFS transporter n=1 Tax=Frigidibacter albus TaxID=1465486 RepID=A0A6L8VMS9_9RHOB|nr:MFS transporter [Frigidibacter albus]MZQ91101.1 MFS transporter [Frigidibacter albus]NBE32986.1 MFS transporter [Frigidibacter albus]GGH62788.1 hypothetical protein GCM10011341_37290 [Frigidibacter albus]